MAFKRLAPALLVIALTAGCASTREFHGYMPDQALPTDIEPDVDTRSTVLARLGSPSTTSVFNDDLWVYMSSTRENLAFYYPRVVHREIVAIQFDDQDVVSDVLTYDMTAGKTIDYSSRITPTRGRELGILEQLFGTIGAMQQIPGMQQERQPGE
jgi:outer membrane protein assembly factor BamE (lipoprotein component of BamABCDE complex)